MGMLCGCATTSSMPMSALQAMPVLPPSSLGQIRSERQIVHAAYADQTATMQCVLEIAPQRLQLIAVNAMGLRLFSVRVEGEQVTVERAPGVPEQIDPARILADVQLAYWPLATLQRAYADSGWNVSEPFAHTRRLTRDGRLISEVHYAANARDVWKQRLWLSNVAFGYTLGIEPQATGAR